MNGFILPLEKVLSFVDLWLAVAFQHQGGLKPPLVVVSFAVVAAVVVVVAVSCPKQMGD